MRLLRLCVPIIIFYLIKFFNVTLHYTRVSSSLMVLTGVSRIRLGSKPRHWNCDYTKNSVSDSPSGSSFTTSSGSGSGSIRFGLYASHPRPISYILFCPSCICLKSFLQALCLLFSRLRWSFFCQSVQFSIVNSG